MFPQTIPSSPMMELSKINFTPVNKYSTEVNLEEEGLKDCYANFNQMVNQLYLTQVYNSANFAQPSPNITNYQYTDPMQQHQQQQLLAPKMPTFFGTEPMFQNASPSLNEMPMASASTSTLSELESMNLQFIHPQDVSFPSVHACTPPTEHLNSRRASLVDSNPAFFNPLVDMELHLQQHTQMHSQSIISQPMMQSHSADILSSVETTPMMSEIPDISAFQDVSDVVKIENNMGLPALKSENRMFDDEDDFEESENLSYIDSVIPEFTEFQKYRVVRGVSSGGCATRPPKEASDSSCSFAKVKLYLSSAGLEDTCFPHWNENEVYDRRRIIRIERRQNLCNIVASFSIVGSAVDHPEPAPCEPDVDFVEVSCLETTVDENYDDYETDRYDSSLKEEQHHHHKIGGGRGGQRQYYITSVEVIKIVELLIGSHCSDGIDRRRERGRVRSNLVPFWSRKPVSSKKGHSASSAVDFRIELAQRIMGYKDRKPRGFDKEVRILKWEKLVPALRRALQCYYVEIPNSKF